MYFKIFIALVSIPLVVGENYTSTSPRKDLTFTELAAYDGYEAEEHTVTTEDGYILTIHHMPAKSNCTSKIPIVFFHGLYLSSDDCVIPGPGKAHCYSYVDNCYEVWAPNVRGNFYSRKHVELDPDEDADFWDYDIDEMAYYDLPAILDYILDNTNQTQVAYVGHSQGAALLFMLCAKNETYNSKIKVAFGLSTTAWLNNARFAVIELQNVLSPILTIAESVGINLEILPRGGISQTVAETICGTSTYTYPLCSAVLFTALGYNEFQITDEVLVDAAAHNPSGTSLKTFNRWGQMKDNGFCEYDYGSIKNLLTYGQLSPPEIDLSGSSAKWILIGSENDYVSDLKDLDTLAANLPNSEICVLSDKTFAHLDFVFGKDISNFITPMMFSYLENGTYTCL